MSSQDPLWMTATSRRQPWALSHVVGLTPQREVVTQLFGVRDGRWQPRDYHVPHAQGAPWVESPSR
jgi:hypothetical protein